MGDAEFRGSLPRYGRYTVLFGASPCTSPQENYRKNSRIMRASSSGLSHIGMFGKFRSTVIYAVFLRFPGKIVARFPNTASAARRLGCAYLAVVLTSLCPAKYCVPGMLPDSSSQ